MNLIGGIGIIYKFLLRTPSTFSFEPRLSALQPSLLKFTNMAHQCPTPSVRQSVLGRTYSRNELFWDMDNVRQYDVCVVGDEGVGKTAIITQFFKHSFIEIHARTNECTVKQKQVKLMDKSISSQELSTIMLNVVDTSTKDDKIIETFLSRKTSCDGIGFLFVYSVQSRASTESFTRFKKHIASLTIDGEIPPIVIIGNQADDESKREVNQVEGEEMAKSLYLPFLEISAKNLSQVEEAFFTLIREISYRLEQDKQPLQKEEWLEKKSGIRKTWKDLWFVLEELKLEYYSHKRESRKDKPKGTIPLAECQVADHPKIGLALVITTASGQKFVIRAENMEQKIQWARLIIRAREKLFLKQQANPSTPGLSSPRKGDSDGNGNTTALAVEGGHDTVRKRSNPKQYDGNGTNGTERERPRSRSAGDSTFESGPVVSSNSEELTTGTSYSSSSSSSTPTSTPGPRAPESSVSAPVVKARKPNELTVEVNGLEVSTATTADSNHTRKKSKDDLLNGGEAGGSTSGIYPNAPDVHSPKTVKKKHTLLGLFIGRTDH